MQKSGLSNIFNAFTAFFILVLLLIYVFAFSGIFRHNKILNELEEIYKKIDHPSNTEILGYSTHLGLYPYLSGSGPDECDYYVAEVRTFSGDFADIESYYLDGAEYFKSKFADSQILAIEINEGKYGPILKPLIPDNLWYETYAQSNKQPSYVVLATFSDVIDTAGDYRCWRD